jgi:hypothetical protein
VIYYEPKDSERVLILNAVLILKAEGLVRLRQDLLLTDEERDAVDGDLVTLARLRVRVIVAGVS